VRGSFASRETVKQAIYGAGFNQRQLYAAAPVCSDVGGEQTPTQFSKLRPEISAQRHALGVGELLRPVRSWSRGHGQRRVRIQFGDTRGVGSARCRTASQGRRVSAGDFKRLSGSWPRRRLRRGRRRKAPISRSTSAAPRSNRGGCGRHTAKYQRERGKRSGYPSGSERRKAVRAVGTSLCCECPSRSPFPDHRVGARMDRRRDYRWGAFARKSAYCHGRRRHHDRVRAAPSASLRLPRRRRARRADCRADWAGIARSSIAGVRRQGPGESRSNARRDRRKLRVGSAV